MKKRVQKNDNIGIFFVATDEYCLVPEYLDEEDVAEIEKALGVRAIRTRIAGTSLIGVFVAACSSGIVVPYIVKEEEVKALKEERIKVLVINDVPTAIGNLIAMNDRGAVISTMIRKKNVEKIGEFFGIEVVQKDVAGNELPGASICVSNKGFIVHPNATDEDIETLKKIFGVGGRRTTANYGDPFVGTCVVANSKGIIVGEETTPVEIMAIEDALG